MPTVVGVFDDRSTTEEALDRLARSGIDVAEMGVMWRERAVSRPEEVSVTVYVDHFETPGLEARKGAVGGAIGGGAAGVGSVLLGSAGVVISSPIGILLAVGTLAATAVAAAAGAVGGSITGGAIGALLGATDHDATKKVSTETEYREVIERDGFVVSIESAEDNIAGTVEALKDAGADRVSVLNAHGELRSVIESDSE